MGKDDLMARGTVAPEAIDYPDSDGLPMAESEFQFWPILYIGSALDCYFQVRDDVYVVGNLLLYYQEGDDRKSVAPDLMVVIGAPKHVRSSYRLWEEPKAPDFVLEVASESTYRSDRGGKRDLYAGMGVSEYWQCDPVGDYLEPSLLGFRLVEGRYVPIPVTTTEGAMLVGHSEVLGLELRLTPGVSVRDVLRFHDPMTGGPLRSLREAEQGREEAERGREEEAQAREEAEARLRQTQDRLRELELELQALRQRGR